MLKSIAVLSALNIGLAFGSDKMDSWLSSRSSTGMETSLNNALLELENMKSLKNTAPTQIETVLSKHLSYSVRSKIDKKNIDSAISDLDRLIKNQRLSRVSESVSYTHLRAHET